MKDERVAASNKLKSDTTRVEVNREQFIRGVHDALLASKICSYAQGMSLIRAGSEEYKWGIDLREMARIWKGGCIIRARILDTIMRAFETEAKLPNLLLELQSHVLGAEVAWRNTVATAMLSGIPVPALSASLAYFDSYRSANLPQNLTQAQRDFFGAHTYQRSDRPEEGFVHTDWQSLIRKSGE
jgi:6-phosphogluconate dehydrogenase